MKKMDSATLITGGTIITFVGSIIIFIGSLLKNKEDATKNKQDAEKQNEISTLQYQLIESQKESLLKQEKLSDVQEQLINVVTSKNSYPAINILAFPLIQNKDVKDGLLIVQLRLIHKGNYDLQNVTGTFLDMWSYQRHQYGIPKPSISNAKSVLTNIKVSNKDNVNYIFDLPTMNSGKEYLLCESTIFVKAQPTTTSYLYSVTISWSSGSISYDINLIREDYIFRIEKVSVNDVLLKDFHNYVSINSKESQTIRDAIN